MHIFYTKELKENLFQKIQEQINEIKISNIKPRIDLIIVGNNPDALGYAQTKQKIGEKLGIQVNIQQFQEDEIDTNKLHQIIIQKNNNNKIHGIILESPFPSDIDFDFLAESIVYYKDIDGLTSKNIGFLMNNQEELGLISATPLACVEILQNLVDKISGLDITLVGNGKTVGKPLAQMLINKGASVDICHSLTKNLDKHCQHSDVIIVAAGSPNLIKKEFTNPNQIIIDVGTNYTPDGLVGDVDFDNVKDHVKAITPVPGGVGPITTMKIFQNLIKAIKLQKNFDIFDISLNDHIKLSMGADLPGGGAISSLGAIYGISMINMVLNLTKENPEEINNFKISLQKNIDNLKKLYQQDINIYNDFLDVLKLPKTTQEQIEYRKHRIQKLSIKACEIPLLAIKICINSINIGQQLLEFSTSTALSDVHVGLHILTASIKSQFELVKGNKKSIKDIEYLQKLEDFEKQIKIYL